MTLEKWKRRRLIKEKYINSVGIRERGQNEWDTAGRERKKEGNKEKICIQTKRARGSERKTCDREPRLNMSWKWGFSDAVIYTDSDSDHFGRMSDHLHFSSCEQTSKTPESEEDRKPDVSKKKKRVRSEAKRKSNAALTVWQLQCVWMNMCVFQPRGIQAV